MQNGLKYAMQTDDTNMRPWNTRYRAVVGGAINLGKWYINRGQDTIYYEKFDIKNFSHQYMTNVLAPRSEATRAKTAQVHLTTLHLSLQYRYMTICHRQDVLYRMAIRALITG